MYKEYFIFIILFFYLFVLSCKESSTDIQETFSEYWTSSRNGIIKHSSDTLQINSEQNTWAEWHSSYWNGPMLSSWEDSSWDKNEIGAFLELGIRYFLSPDENDTIIINLSDTLYVSDINIWVQLYKWSEIENKYISSANYCSHKDQLDNDNWINLTSGIIRINCYNPTIDDINTSIDVTLENVKLELIYNSNSSENDNYPNSIEIINAHFLKKPKSLD